MATDLYVFRVKLKWAKGVWREIAVRGDQTLHDLHLGILDAFEWTEVANSTYRFHMDKDVAHTPHERGRDGFDTEATTLQHFDLDEDDTCLYFFGEGDNNQFVLRVVSVEDPEPGVDYPDVVDENGDSPDQDRAF